MSLQTILERCAEALDNCKKVVFMCSLTSELSMLETRLHRNKDKFWKNKKQANKYTYYLATKDRVEKMAKIIEAYEEELALVCMNLKPYNTHMSLTKLSRGNSSILT